MFELLDYVKKSSYASCRGEEKPPTEKIAEILKESAKETIKRIAYDVAKDSISIIEVFEEPDNSEDYDEEKARLNIYGLTQNLLNKELESENKKLKGEVERLIRAIKEVRSILMGFHTEVHLRLKTLDEILQ